MTPASSILDDEPFDVVGPRVLVGIQMINISRLSTHPVPITTSGLITVAGQGPTDSNGAGKSSFIAALSLLHADSQWRLQSGAPAAAEMLFTAELAGQEALHANADRGFIIGVYAPPAANTLADLEAGVLTVWLRLNRQSPHLELRWRHQLHLPYGETENERAAGADDLWNALPRSNGRTDLRANRLAKTLYGDTVRCVSFLSTSVRASPTANLLAQPLNELSPDSIFDAIGALTGLTGELEQEQKARSIEYNEARAAQQAQEQFDEWDQRMTIVENGILARRAARELLDDARKCWRSRCARSLVDGVEEADGIAEDLKANETHRAELVGAIETTQAELGRLTDDTAFEASYRQRVDAHTRLEAQLKDLEKIFNQNVGEIESQSRRKRELETKAQAADGLTVEQAVRARIDTETTLSAAQQAKGVTAAARSDANKALTAAERGEDVAAGQVQALRTAGIESVPLVDAITLTQAQRAVWEARLLPYRHAVVVRHHDAAAASAVLTRIPGSLLVRADRLDDSPRSGVDLPQSVVEQLPVTGFLAVLSERAGTEPAHIDVPASVFGISGFPQPLTGRAGRIREARDTLDSAAAADDEAGAAVDTAQRQLGRAREREEAAQAGAAAVDVAGAIEKLRAANEANQGEQDKLAAPMATAKRDYQQALADKEVRDGRIKTVRDEVQKLEAEAQSAQDRWQALSGRRDALDLADRHAAWGEKVEAAHEHLNSLPENEQKRTLIDWDDTADELAERVRRGCFPAGTPAEQLPEELRVVEDRRAGRRSPDRITLIPAVLRIIDAYLAQHAQVDTQQQAEIEQERADRTRTLASAQAALTEAQQASAALRGTLAAAIKATLKQVSTEFDRIDRAYGGYGGVLEFPEPEPPADPEKQWRWSVTPKWRRSEGKAPASYRLRGNTAQMDDKAVKLVCAAALAGTGERPLLLVLDELGRNLGAAHRRDAVALFENIGRDRAISVVGALQDDMERYAIGASSLYVKLRRTSDTIPYNQAPIVIGNDTNHERVQMLAEWMTSYRPQPQT